MSHARKSSRREFLRGRSAVDAIHEVADAIGQQLGDAGLTLPDPQSANLLVHFGRRAMACEFEVLLHGGQYPNGAEAAVEALDLVDQLEAQLSVYRDDSEVSRLNQAADQNPVEVEPRLFALLQLAAKIHRETGGAYDITSGPLTKAWGFYRRAGSMPTDDELNAALRSVGMSQIELDPQRHAVRFQQAGMEINLGSIGKGYALDRAAEQLVAAGIDDFLLHGGNSSVLARGSEGALHPSPLPEGEGEYHSPSQSGGWWIGLRHPLRPDVRWGKLRLHNRALGTSGGGTQFFIHEGRRYGHIIDPRSGRPTEGVISTTVAAPSGAEADALATAFYVLGVEASLDYCRRHAGLSAVLIAPADPLAFDEQSDRVEITLWGFECDDIVLDVDPSVIVRKIDA